jgi:hypothetical protein
MAENYNYWVTFRVKEDSTSNRRRQGMVDAAVSIEKGRWMEPTSFFLLESSKDAATLVAYLAATLDVTKDVLVAVDIANPADAAYFGAVEDVGVLKSFIWNIKKVE